MDVNKKMGYIPLWRDMLNMEWFTEPNVMHFYIYCLLRANYKDVHTKGGLIKRGEFVRSLEQMSNETGLTIQQIRTCIKKLSSYECDKSSQSCKNIENSTQYLTQSKFGKSLKYTVKNYDKIFSLTQSLTINQQRNNNEITTNNKSKERKEGVVVGDGAPTYDYDDDFLKFWNAYLKHGYMEDTYKYWLSQNYDNEVVEDIVHGASRYSEDYEDNKKGMIFPRTFLINEKWKDYPRPKPMSQMEFDEEEAELAEYRRRKKLAEEE